jgi:hypothetical protein
MRRAWKWLAGGAALVTGIVVIACSDASPTGPETAIPSFGAQGIGACARWSCAIADCTNDPAIYGPCCVDVVDEGQHEVARPTCGGDEYPGGPGDCGPSTYESGEIYAAGCYCDAQYACCYYQIPSSLSPGSCNLPF